MIPGGLFEDPPLLGFVRNPIWDNTRCPSPVCLSLLRQLDWLVAELDRKCANLQPDPGEGRSQEPAFGAFTSRIHHQSQSEAHLEREHGLTKHLLHKINASRLLPVQVALRGASDPNYQECYRNSKPRSAACANSTTGPAACPRALRRYKSFSGTCKMGNDDLIITSWCL